MANYKLNYTGAQIDEAIGLAFEQQETKANIDGAYENMTVGNAEQLVSSVVIEDKVPYNFRTSGGSVDIGNRMTDKVIGGTIAWNQLVDTNTVSVTPKADHIYFMRVGGTESLGKVDSTVSVTGSTDNIFDLTTMFGSTVANFIYSIEQSNIGAGVSWFKKLFPKDYYAYNDGTLMSVKTSKHITVGFNAYDNSTGTAKLVGGMQYQITGTYTALSYSTGETITPDASGYFTPTATGELTVTGGNATDTCVHLVWDGERDGEFEEYVKHEYALDDSLELRGIPKRDANDKLYYDGDVYESDGKVTRRYGIVDLGTLTFTRTQYGSEFYYFRCQYPSIAYGEIEKIANMICAKFETVKTGTLNLAKDKTITNYQTNNLIMIRDDSYTDVATFKAAMSGVYLVYELATTTEESAESYTNPQIVDDFGTEEYVDYAEAAGTRDVAIPVGHDTLYQSNLRAKIEMAPDSPDGDGDYVVRQEDGNNTYVPYVSPIPAAPAEDGTYVLKATVTSGEATLSWEAQA